jgi:hypothetical protein
MKRETALGGRSFSGGEITVTEGLEGKRVGKESPEGGRRGHKKSLCKI